MTPLGEAARLLRNRPFHYVSLLLSRDSPRGFSDRKISLPFLSSTLSRKMHTAPLTVREGLYPSYISSRSAHFTEYPQGAQCSRGPVGTQVALLSLGRSVIKILPFYNSKFYSLNSADVSTLQLQFMMVTVY